MKKSLKLIISSLIITLTFLSPQAIQGMEDFSTLVNKAHKFTCCPEEIKLNILERTVIDNYLSDDHATSFVEKLLSLKLVCKEWHGIINKDFVNRTIKSAYALLGYGEVYQRFLNGVLIYRPQKGSDVGMIKLPIGGLVNPLEGTFDLSLCGDIGKYLSISTGYRKGKKAENANKVEIWFAPRFLIEMELKTTASHFQGIYGRWSNLAPVGIFWTWGGSDNLTYMDYLTTQNMNDISNDNLYEKWRTSAPLGGSAIGDKNKFIPTVPQQCAFHVHIELR